MNFRALASVSLVAAVTQTAMAQQSPHTPLPIRSPGTGLSQNVVEKLERAALRMTLGPNQTYCTVFPVSADGYLLTALHCVRACLEAQGKAEVASNSFIGLQDLFVVKRPGATNTSCADFQLLSSTNSAPIAIRGTVQIVATGSALSTFESKFLNVFSGLHNELRMKGWSSKANDYALLKVQPNQAFRCLKMKTSAASAGDALWAVGYPAPANATLTPVLSASAGRLYGQPTESLQYNRMKNEADRNWITTQYFDRGVIYSNAANDFGQSGGPVVSSDGEVIGITSGFTSSEGPSGSSINELVATSLQKVLGELPNSLSQAVLLKNRVECQ